MDISKPSPVVFIGDLVGVALGDFFTEVALIGVVCFGLLAGVVCFVLLAGVACFGLLAGVACFGLLAGVVCFKPDFGVALSGVDLVGDSSWIRRLFPSEYLSNDLDGVTLTKI